MFKKFTVKDIVFLAIFSAVLLAVGGLVMPLVMFTHIYALRQLVSAPLFALFCIIAIYKVPKPGALSIIGLITGLVLSFMSPIMFFNNFFGAVIAELITLLIFRSYEKPAAPVLAAGLYIPLTLPITLVSTQIMKGKSIAEQINDPMQTVWIVIGTFILSFLGAFIGKKIAKELRKAGKLL
ncbi:MAG: MptD family putative ECF transporter S component [Eubacteriales bacterium]|nr:MptD family putative ECF transporter S component [Eubacteriales bacterium]